MTVLSQMKKTEKHQVFHIFKKTSKTQKKKIHICGWFGAFCGKYKIWLQHRW